MRVTPVEQSVLDTWNERSLKADGLIRANQKERHRIKIQVLNACVYDCVVQALAWLYIDEERFRETVDERIRRMPDNADLPRLIAVLSEQGATDRVYRLRRELLSKSTFALRTGDMKVFRSEDLLLKILTYFVTPSFPSMTSTSDCKCRIEKKYGALPPDGVRIMKNGPKKLRFEIDIKNERKPCRRCGQKRTEEHVFGDIVFVYLGDSYEEGTRSSQLSIPQTIALGDENYALACFFDVNEKSHLTAFCFRKNGKRIVYNDNADRVLPFREDGLVQCLLYRKKE